MILRSFRYEWNKYTYTNQQIVKRLVTSNQTSTILIYIKSRKQSFS